MEKRLNKRIETYITEFKDKVCNKVNELNIEEKSKASDLIEFIYEYSRFTLTKDDLNKRKRIKNAIPSSNRCSAKRANGEQCTRRRKENCEFCGTHAKGTPNGLMQNNNECNPCMTTQKIEVFAEDIYGIVYYIDKYNNVYKTEDILENKENPLIIAKYVKENEKYTIPEFGLM
jgi:hypothetical protein